MDYPFKQEEGEDEVHLCIVCCSIVKVPDSQLEENLVNCGDPVNWIRLCEQCTQLTRQAENLHWNIVKTQEQLRSVHQLILDKTKTPSSLSTDKTIGNWERREIWSKTRAFLSNCDQSLPNSVNPFIEGDKLANYLSQQNISTSLLILPKGQDQDGHVKIEVDHFQGDDSDWEPPPEVDDLEDDQDTIDTTSQTQSGSKPLLRCHLCPLRVPKQNILNRHLYRRHKDDPVTVRLIENGYQLFQCQEYRCHAIFSKQKSLDKHIEKEHKPNQSPPRFSCQFCSKEYATKQGQKTHELLHTNRRKSFKCEICKRKLNSFESLAKHMWRIHKIKKRRPKQIKTVKSVVKGSETRVCHLCGKTLAEGSLKSHMVAFHKEDPLAKQLIEEGYGIWRCKVPGCSKKFNYKLRLTEHLEKIHGNKVEELAHFCQFCGKGFYAEESLKRHEKQVHEMIERRFICEICGFGMTTQLYLDGHMKRVHKPNKKFGGEVKGDKVFICSICGIQFWERVKLDKHRIIHDKDAEQPHPCDICGRGYSTNESMWKHKRKVHKIYRRPDDSRIKK